MGRTVSLLVVAVAAVFVVGLSGCVVAPPTSSGVQGTNTPTSTSTSVARTYQPIDYKKWASGMYPDEFLGRAVLVDGYIQKSPSIGAIESSIHFVVRQKSLSQIKSLAMKSSTSAHEAIYHMVSVSAPMSMRDTFFNIPDHQRVRVYGVVVNPYARSGITGQITSSMLQVQADRIEVVR